MGVSFVTATLSSPKAVNVNDAHNPTHFMTWLRDPVERVASHYYYWQHTYKLGRSPALHQRIMEEQWTLEQFCLSPELRNLYHQFLFLIPLRRFSFVGITEHFTADLAFFSRHYLGNVDLTTYQEKVNTTEKRRHSYIEDPVLRQRIERWHAKDMALYQHAVNVSLARR